MKRLTLLFLAVVLVAVSAPRGYAAPTYERLFYFRESKRARESFFAYPAYIDIFAPQAYSLTGDGKLVGKVAQDLLDFAKKRGIKVMPLVVNKTFNRAHATDLLDDETKQTDAIAALVTEARQKGYWGWQADFEQMDLSYRDKYSKFVDKFGRAMKANSLISSVAVIAQVSEKPEDYPRDLWLKLIGVYDYRALASSTDFLSVMSYDDPESKGPIARYSWLKRVLAHTLTLVPKEKVSLGLGLYYWQWNDATGKRVGIGGHEGILNVLNKYRVVQYYHWGDEAPYLSYRRKGTPHLIWFENKQSVKKKLQLITDSKLRGFSAWALGLESPSVYQAIPLSNIFSSAGKSQTARW